MGRPVVHFEINTPDNDANARFYSELFGWHVEMVPMPQGAYGLVDTHAGSGINGGLGHTDDGSASITVFVAVPDIDATLAKVETLGGKTVVPTTEIPNVVTFAVFADPLGCVIGVVKDDGGESPGVGAGSNPPVAWFEILSSDPKAQWAFYNDVFDWTVTEGGDDGFLYGEANTGEHAIGGGIGSSRDGSPFVTVYARVDDVQSYLDKAAALGATTVMGPMNVNDSLIVAAFKDPQGAVFGLFSM